MDVPERVISRVLTKTVVSNACLVSLYHHRADGYVSVGWKENGTYHYEYVHRIAWVAQHGRIPDDLTVDHMCGNRACCNVDHLRLLTLADNIRAASQRGGGGGRHQLLKTHCPHGHPYNEVNTRIHKRGWRNCRACQHIRNHTRQPQEK